MKNTAIKLKRFLVSMILLTCTCMFSTITSYNGENNSCNTKQQIDSIQIQLDSIHHKKIQIKNELIEEVSKYIAYKAPNAHVNKISEHLVENCLLNNIDICFVMSQTQIETNFGTTGAGKINKRKSLFGVANKKYDSYETAIIDYINILQKLYLVNGKTEKNLLNNYVTKHGARYAESRNYEYHLKVTYNSIKNNTSIYQLQKKITEDSI